MKKLFLLIVTVVMLINSISAQSGWKWQHPLPQGNALYSISMVTNRGWAVGPLGTAIRTTNAGVSWEKVELGTTENLNCVFMHSETQIFIAGDNGLILYLYDDGTNVDVTRQESNTNVNLRSITSHINGCQWAAGDSGTVLRSTDMGASWIKLGPHYDNNLYSIHNIECTTAYAAGLNGYIMYTTDWGISWTVSIPTTKHLLSIDIGTFEYVRAVGNLGTILLSTDHGKTWTAENSGTNSHLNDILNIGSARAYAAGTDGVILETTDTGEPWIQRNSGTDATLYDAEDQWNYDHIWVTGEDGIILKNSGTGTDFKIQNEGTRLWLGAVKFIDENNGWAVGGDMFGGTNAGIILSTTNGGLTWNERNTAIHLNAVDFANGLNGWAVGEDGIIRHTHNGESWGTQTSPVNSDLNAVCFIDENTGWAAGDYGKIIHTTNGGTDWVVQSNPMESKYGNLWGIRFVNETNGYAVGEFSTILYTTNSGETWLEQNANASQNFLFTSVYFINKTHGWITSNGGRIFLTTDGGDNWEQLDIEDLMGVGLESVYFTDQNNGWAVGVKGTVMHSTDGGYTWNRQYSGVAYNTLVAVCFIDTATGWAVGEGGAIIRTTNGGGIIESAPETSKRTFPEDFTLYQNFPNPFNPITRITWQSPVGSWQTLKVYDILGREISILVNEYKPAGKYQVEFDASNLPCGVYFYRMQAGNFSATKKLIILK